MPSVSLMIKPASGNCNMHCDYCFYRDESAKRERSSYGFMNEKTLKNIIRKFILSAEASCTIIFQGGEPTLWGLENFEKVIQYAEQYNKNHIQIHYTLQTNGLCLTEEWCEFFRRNHFLIGISVDGTPATHNQFRHAKNGTESYRNVLQTTKLLDAHHIDYNILTVVHKETAPNIRQIYADYHQKGWNYLQFIACIEPYKETKGLQRYSLLPYEYGVFLNELFELWYADLQKGIQPYIRQFENYVSILAGYRPESCDQTGTCSIQYVVEANGNVYPCDFYAMDDFFLGNINECSIADLNRKREEIDFIGRSLNHSAHCLECKWFSLCRGGCYRHREELEDNYYCESYRMFFEANYDRLKHIADILV